MRRKRIKVDCYAGSRADERPRRVVIEDREHVVARLLSATVEESATSRDRLLRFRVLTQDGTTLDILRDKDGEWYLE